MMLSVHLSPAKWRATDHKHKVYFQLGAKNWGRAYSFRHLPQNRLSQLYMQECHRWERTSSKHNRRSAAAAW